MADWRQVSAHVRREMGHPAEARLGYRVCTTRANGYEPAVAIPPREVRGIDIHSEVDGVLLAFRSAHNIAHLQHECERRGLGRPAPESFYKHMHLALQVDPGTMHPGAVPDYAAYVREMVATLNARVLAMIVPLMEANKIGFIAHQKDLSFRQLQDATPHISYECSQQSARPEHPHYHGI